MHAQLVNMWIIISYTFLISKIRLDTVQKINAGKAQLSSLILDANIILGLCTMMGRGQKDCDSWKCIIE